MMGIRCLFENGEAKLTGRELLHEYEVCSLYVARYISSDQQLLQHSVGCMTSQMLVAVLASALHDGYHETSVIA